MMINFEKLKPFCYGLSSKTRLMLYLYAEGYEISELIEFKDSTLAKINVPDNLIDDKATVLGSKLNEFVFTYPNGRKYSSRDIYQMLSKPVRKVLGKNVTLQQLREHLD